MLRRSRVDSHSVDTVRLSSSPTTATRAGSVLLPRGRHPTRIGGPPGWIHPLSEEHKDRGRVHHVWPDQSRIADSPTLSPLHPSRPLGLEGTSTACSRSAERGTICRANSWVEARTTCAPAPSLWARSQFAAVTHPRSPGTRPGKPYS